MKEQEQQSQEEPAVSYVEEDQTTAGKECGDNADCSRNLGCCNGICTIVCTFSESITVVGPPPPPLPV